MYIQQSNETSGAHLSLGDGRLEGPRLVAFAELAEQLLAVEQLVHRLVAPLPLRLRRLVQLCQVHKQTTLNVHLNVYM